MSMTISSPFSFLRGLIIAFVACLLDALKGLTVGDSPALLREKGAERRYRVGRGKTWFDRDEIEICRLG